MQTRKLATKLALAWVAVVMCSTATPAGAQIDLSHYTLETVIPSEFEGGFLNRVVEMVVADDGIWVNDVDQLKLFQFDHTGSLVVEYGRQGSGPGEFLLPGGLRVDSVVTVMDQRQGRLVRFALDGEHLDTRRVRGPVGSVMPLRNGVTATLTMGWYSFGENAVGNPFNHVILGFPGAPAADTIATYHFGNARWTGDGRMGVFNPRFGNGGAWAVMGDSAIVVADGSNGSVVFFTARSSRRLTNVSDLGAAFAVDTVSLGSSADPVSSSDRIRAERDLRQGETNLPAQMDIDGWPDHWSMATDLLVANDGRVWARQVVYGDGGQHWTEVDRHRPERTRYVLPERFRLLAVADDKLYGVALDELGIQRVAMLNLP